ncbi:MAG: trans-aconitate 2-methyltransferase [Polyangiales bacterium]
MPTWDEAQYLKFADERTRAARELLARVPVAAPAHVVDLGCGPGNSTALLAARWPDARVVGVDSSPEMLTRARRDLPALTFVASDAGRYAPDAPVDVWFANALMQWLPEHPTLLVDLLKRLTPGGALAVQVPNNFQAPSHRLMRELEGPWRDAVAGIRDRARIEDPSSYYDRLAPHAAYVDVWQTTYEHVMADPPAIVEWLKGTGLRPYLEAIEPAHRDAYVAAYTEAIDAAYPRRSDGKRLFSFPRLFLVAVRG